MELILPAKSSRDGGDLCFQDGKSWISIFQCTIFLLLKRVSVTLLLTIKSVRLRSLKSMNTFHFLGSVLQNRRS